MKKVLLTAAAVFAFTFANAQESTSSYKPVKGTITTEVGLVGGLNNADFNLNNSNNFETGVLKFRYFLKDDLAARLGVGINTNKKEELDHTDPANVATLTNKNSDIAFNFGIEKHFAGTDRLSTYAGADILVGFKNANAEFSDNTTTQEIDGANADMLGNISNPASNYFGLRVLTGADYYIAKKVFLGVEAGLSVTTGKEKDIEFTSAGTTTTIGGGGKVGGFETTVFGGVRIGYQF